MTNLPRWIAIIVVALTVTLAAGADASPVIYTLRTVADGKLGNHTFYEALVTIRMKSDTQAVRQQVGSNGGVLYTNFTGTATVSITENGVTTVATFAPGEVYVRYDAGAAIAGFGSAISPTYPIAIGCDDYAFPSDSGYVKDCTQGDWGPLDPKNPYVDTNGTLSFAALALNWPAYQPLVSAETLALPANLSQSTLITGRTHTCATTYKVGTLQDFIPSGSLLDCKGEASRGLRTDHGGFYLRDKIGGSSNVGWGGWLVSNSGALQVEVLHHRDE
jgi:hypothetical protein